MNFAEKYFQKYSYQKPQILEPPSGLLRFIVVIPAYLEDGIYDTLKSLKRADKPVGGIEVIIVVNYSETDSIENKKRNLEINVQLHDWCLRNNDNNNIFHTILADNLPKKHAGVGIARKIGMDEAISRFGHIDCPDGMILSLDADAIVDKNYFTAIEKKLQAEKTEACILKFAHELEGRLFDLKIYNAIAEYELHLRYYKHILNYTGFPYASYTIGSCFGVIAETYTKQGGMNRKQAGEDFYFLNKVIPNHKIAEINDTCITLSARPSLRVPFGTGPTVSKISKQAEEGYSTYHPRAFFELKLLFDVINQLFENSDKSVNSTIESLTPLVQQFLEDQNFADKLAEIRANAATRKSFIKRFYSWFDAFKVVKYLNFAHQGTYNKIPVIEALEIFSNHINYKFYNQSVRGILMEFRVIDNEGNLHV